MLTISKASMQAFEAAAVLRFEDDMLDHVRTYFPNHYRLGGESGVRALIRLAIERARGYGISSQRGVCLVLNTMLLLGASFDQDPQLPWVAAVCTGGYAEPDWRAATLADRARDWLSAIAGPDNRALNRTLVQLHKDSAAVFRYPPQGALPQHLLHVARWISAAKCELAGAPALHTLIGQTVSAAPQLGLDTNFGQVCHLAFSFVLGSGYLTDPLHGWAAGALQTGLAGDALAAQLHTAAMAALGDFLAHA